MLKKIPMEICSKKQTSREDTPMNETIWYAYSYNENPEFTFALASENKQFFS